MPQNQHVKVRKTDGVTTTNMHERKEAKKKKCEWVRERKKAIESRATTSHHHRHPALEAARDDCYNLA